MKHELYSELRTVYETTVANPHTFRVTLKMKDIVDEPVLAHALELTAKRYPYYAQRIVIESGGDTGDRVFFEDNPAPIPLIHSDDPPVLGSEAVSGHILALSWWKNKIHIEVYHALTDGGGIYNFIKTLIHYYCSEYYGLELSTEGIRLSDDPVDPAEWEDPARAPVPDDLSILVPKWEGPAFQIMGDGGATPGRRCEVYNIRIPEAEFMRFNLSNDGSPGTIIALLLANAIERAHPDAEKPVVIAMCVNQRRALGAPLAHQSLVGDVRLVHSARTRAMSFMDQATCFRGMVSLQSDSDMVLNEIADYQRIVEDLEALPTHAERHRYAVERMDRMTDCFTATVSYVGKTSMGEAEHFIQEFHVLPSTALPSSATPLTIELSAINGSFYVNFMQYFEEDVYLRNFIKQLRENGIDYDVLYQEQTKFPGMIALWE